MSSATYVYCVVRSAARPPAARSPQGLAGASRPTVTSVGGKLWLVCAAVPLERYGAPSIEASLTDLEWVSAVALAHEAVVEFFTRSRGTTVIPMKLFTIFSSPERAFADVRRRRRALDRVFERIAGCEEWGVRVTRESDRRAASTAPAAAPASGTAFLAARKQARDRARAEAVAASAAADSAFESLGVIARERTRRVDDVAGVAAPLLDAAFLVPARRRSRFQAAARLAARDVARSGGTMTLTGPWPAYNFVGGEDAP